MNTCSAINEDFFAFVAKHKGEDPFKLRLKFNPQAGDAIDLAITHLQCLQKAGKKFIDVTGKSVAPEVLLSPLSIEQASSAEIAAFHASLVPEGGVVLDMTCGLGIDTLAFATMRGCSVTTCEMNPLHADAAEYNFRSYPYISVIKGDGTVFLAETDSRFDVIFIDPARRDSCGGRVYNIHDCTPDVAEIMSAMKSKADKIVIKLSPMLDVTQTVRDLAPTDIYAVQGGGECKELLAVIDCKCDNCETKITIVKDDTRFEFTQMAEAFATPDYGEPEQGDYLYEPCAAAMKAAPFKLLSERFCMKKLHPNTHLYFSKSPTQFFPGKEYKVLEIMDFSSSEIKNFAKKYPRMNVAVRNFFLTADVLAKRLKVKSGGDLKAFGVTLHNGSRKIIIGK